MSTNLVVSLSLEGDWLISSYSAVLFVLGVILRARGRSADSHILLLGYFLHVSRTIDTTIFVDMLVRSLTLNLIVVDKG